MPVYSLQPLDTLFFRDARPFDASGGHGAHWPLPTVTHEALRSALLRLAGESPAGKKITHHKRSSSGNVREKRVASDAFRSLRTLGPFPLLDEQLYFPMPADLVPVGMPAETDEKTKGTSKDEKRVLVAPLAPLNTNSLPAGIQSNLPADWLLPVYSRFNPSKDKTPQWTTLLSLKQYLDLESEQKLEIIDANEKLYTTEHRIGIEIDRETHSTKEGQFYTAEHLRLCSGVTLWLSATLNDSDKKHSDGLNFLKQLPNTIITLGGESRACRIAEMPADKYDLSKLLPPPQKNSKLIKWVLVTPAVFNNGWRPSWINKDNGHVLLKADKDGDLQRHNGENRLAWRERVRKLPEINAYLKAVCMPKPMFFSGWDVNLENNGRLGGPKPTYMAVASGAVYYFEAHDEENARALVRALHGRTMSDCFGEKGLGLGFCGSWHYVELPKQVENKQ